MGDTAESSPRFTFSFGFKLMVAMLLMVAIISSVTLVVVQNRVDSVYREFLAGQFAEQADLFFEKRDARLSEARTLLADALVNVRLVAALQAGDYERFQSDLVFEASQILDRYQVPEGAEAAKASLIFRYVLESGEMLVPTETRAGYVAGLEESELAKALAPLSHMGDSGSGGEIGYLTLESMYGPVVYEILVLPHVDFYGSGDYLGDLIFGTPVLSMSEFAGGGGTDRKNAILVGGHVFSDHISVEDNEALKKIIGTGLDRHSEQVELDIGGVPHRLFYRPLTSGTLFPEAYQITLFSLAGLRSSLGQIRNTIIIVSLLALLVGIGLSFIVSQRMTQPIHSLVEGFAEISKGNFGYRLPVKSRDEIGMLTRSYNEASTELALKEEMRSVLDKVTDRSVAERLLSGAVDLGGELRDITVLFCDIRGFTPLTETMEPADVINMLNEHMTAMTGIVREHHGVVDKFVGDEIMVLFGAPESYGNDALNAARCAHAMREERNRLNTEGQYVFKIGFGLASGEMVAGNMGSEDRLNYTVLGERVNLASRLCSAAGPMEILIDSVTESRVRDQAEVVAAGDLTLKGISSAVKAFSLQNISDSS